MTRLVLPSNVGRHGQLVPIGGFSRRATPMRDLSAWRSADGINVLSQLVDAVLPGTEAEIGPTWVVSVSVGNPPDLHRPTDEHMQRVVDAFVMPAYDEDNHFPGVTRTLFCPVAEQYRHECECKLTETVVTDPDGYRWTTPTDGPCSGCAYEQAFGRPCPLHGGA